MTAILSLHSFSIGRWKQIAVLIFRRFRGLLSVPHLGMLPLMLSVVGIPADLLIVMLGIVMCRCQCGDSPQYHDSCHNTRQQKLLIHIFHRPSIV